MTIWWVACSTEDNPQLEGGHSARRACTGRAICKEGMQQGGHSEGGELDLLHATANCCPSRQRCSTSARLPATFPFLRRSLCVCLPRCSRPLAEPFHHRYCVTKLECHACECAASDFHASWPGPEYQTMHGSRIPQAVTHHYPLPAAFAPVEIHTPFMPCSPHR